MTRYTERNVRATVKYSILSPISEPRGRPSVRNTDQNMLYTRRIDLLEASVIDNRGSREFTEMLVPEGATTERNPSLHASSIVRASPSQELQNLSYVYGIRQLKIENTIEEAKDKEPTI
jgi:hypothetical protein